MRRDSINPSSRAPASIRNVTNEILISPASYWEIAIKVSLGKWRLNRPQEEFRDFSLAATTNRPEDPDTCRAAKQHMLRITTFKHTSDRLLVSRGWCRKYT